MIGENDNKEQDIDDIDIDDTENIEDTHEPETGQSTSEQEKLSICEDKLQRALADYQNLDRRNNIEVSQKILQKTNQLMLSFIGVYEDFIRAQDSLSKNNVDTSGIEIIRKKSFPANSGNNLFKKSKI